MNAPNWLRLASRAFFIQDLVSLIISWMPPVFENHLGKYLSIKKAFYMNSMEGVEGDYLEFGVYTGSSMSAAVRFSKINFFGKKQKMRFFGFDSFRGFGKLTGVERRHPWLKNKNFKSDYEMVKMRLCRAVDDPSLVVLVPGFFDKTLRNKKPKDYGIKKAGVVLIDCDIYSAAKDVFGFLGPVIQEGTILILDDCFLFRGSPVLGVFGAFKIFEKKHPEWVFRHMWTYGAGGMVFIAGRSSL